ncbi:MAB_1171c family putative transporter [Gordonia westfalica]|uniref:MAB_1171c family putative transporter n=1 Tax=Gordonia westfalica TaxID=158898 RepID=A0ABU2GW32_9ACTN|nr:MAB_1171c family putative transporter [Gordonia westfalica]MDS1115125.1 MAB_1171c family putative transporter [Gordonia westfalica]
MVVRAAGEGAVVFTALSENIDSGIGVVNAIAAAVFAFAFCWRLDQIRRAGWGLQPLAMMVAVASLTLAFVVIDESVAAVLNDNGFEGLSRVAFYALLAIGVAALVIVFFFPDRVTRERRAGWEALPLVASLVGLQVTMLVIPVEIRTATISEWTVQNWGFALFILIASGYLTYGFGACVNSVRKFYSTADGYLRVSLGLLIAGLGLLALSAVCQIAFVIVSATGVVRSPWLVTTNRVVAILGIVVFLLGISYPMAYARVQSVLANRRRRRLDTDLLPLWRLVTDAVPEVVLPDPGQLSPTTRLHRRVVETRDALTQVSPYLPVAFDYAEVGVQARMLRAAVAAMTSTEAGDKTSGAVRNLAPADGEGLEADAAPLIRLSTALLVPEDTDVSPGSHAEAAG